MRLLTRLALITLFILGMALPAMAQYTTVSSTGVTDNSGILYSSGTYNITLVNSTGQPPYFQGAPLPTSQTLYSGVLSTTATFSLSIPSSAYILAGPGGPASQTTWNFTVCAKGGLSCYSAATAVSGSAQDVTSTINAAAVALTFFIPGLPPAPSGANIVANSLGFTYGSASGTSIAGNQNAVYASPKCPSPYVSGNCYWVHDDWQWVYDATTNTAATTCNGTTVTAGTCISITATDPPFSCGGASFPCTTGGDTTKIAFGTGDPFAGNVLFTQGTTVTFVKIIDATHAQVSAAVNSSLAGTAVFLWGTDDTANLQAADNARYYSATYCGTLYLPQGGMATSAGLFNLPSGKCTEFGTATIGAGELNTFIIALPTLPIASCAGLGTNICFGGAPAGTQGKTLARDWTLWGGGNTRAGQSDGAKVLANFTFMEDWEGIGWASLDSSSLTGVSLSGQGGYMTNASASDGFGSIACQVTGNGVRISGSFCGETGTTSLVVAGSTATLLSQGNIFGPCCINSTPGTDVQVTTNASMTSIGDVTVNPQPGSSDDYTVGAASGSSYLNLISVTCTATGASDIPLFVLSGGVMSAFKTNCTAPSAGVGLDVASGGQFFDDGGENHFNPANATVTVAGQVFGDLSITGTPVVAGNLAASAGWGSTAAFTSISGNARLVQFTLTNSGTGQAASPTITYTFPASNPTGFIGTPICTATQVGGNNPLVATANFTPTTVTNLSAIFTYNGTPTVSDTEIIQISCHVQ